MVKAKKPGVCVRLNPEHTAAAEALVRHVRDHGLRSLPDDLRAALDHCDANLDSVSDVVRVALQRLFDEMKDQTQ